MSWGFVKFSSLFAEGQRNGLTKPRSVRGSGIKFINMGELFENDRIDASVETDRVPVSHSELETSLVQTNDLLFARQSLVREGAGKCSIVLNVSEPTTYDSHLIRVRLDKSLAIPDFYRYYFASSYSPIPGIISQCAQAGIKGSDLANLKVSYPPLKTQERVVGILKAFDDLIDNNRRQIKLLEEAAQRLYKEWFVDMRFPGYENAPFDEGLPAGWSRTQMSELLKVRNGKDHKHLNDGTIPVYGSGGLMRKVDTALFVGESVLIPRKGTLNNVMYVNEAFWTVDTMFHTEVTLPHGAKYLYHALKAIDFYSLNVGAAVPSMTQAIIKGLSVIVPDSRTLESFDIACTALFGNISLAKKNIEVAQEARDRLLPKLMSGEIEV